MKVIYVPNEATEEELERSIFLAGPTPRSQDVKSWRPEFIELLKGQAFEGSVLVPETEDGVFKHDYMDQVEWEYSHLSGSACIAFWVPRDLETLPGFTTNVEFGYWLHSDNMLYGRPEGAPKTKYLDWMYKKVLGIEPIKSMADLAREVADYV